MIQKNLSLSLSVFLEAQDLIQTVSRSSRSVWTCRGRCARAAHGWWVASGWTGTVQRAMNSRKTQIFSDSSPARVKDYGCFMTERRSAGWETQVDQTEKLEHKQTPNKLKLCLSYNSSECHFCTLENNSIFTSSKIQAVSQKPNALLPIPYISINYVQLVQYDVCQTNIMCSWDATIKQTHNYKLFAKTYSQYLISWTIDIKAYRHTTFQLC